MTGSKTFKQLIVWQAAHELVLMVYGVTKAFPKEEQFALTSQLRRAAISVTSNIAEGYGRRTTKDKEHFYVMARGSLDEIDSQLQIAHDLNYMQQATYRNIMEKHTDTARLLNALLRAHKNF